MERKRLKLLGEGGILEEGILPTLRGRFEEVRRKIEDRLRKI